MTGSNSRPKKENMRIKAYTNKLTISYTKTWIGNEIRPTLLVGTVRQGHPQNGIQQFEHPEPRQCAHYTSDNVCFWDLSKNNYLWKRLTNDSLSTTKCTRNGTSTTKHWGKKCIQNPLHQIKIKNLQTKKVSPDLSTPIDQKKYNLYSTAKKLEGRRLEVQIQHPSTTTNHSNQA